MMYFIAMLITLLAIAFLLSGLWWIALPLGLLVLWMVS